jgi:hypothetical protein
MKCYNYLDKIHGFTDLTNYNDYEFYLQIYEFDEFTNYND